ncbi:MAG TPA: DUF2207 domain-containing protein [Acidimicrobiales bacterium]
MRTGRRRLLDGVLALGGCAVLAGGAAVGAALSDTERVTRFWTRAEVASDGNAAVVEQIDYSFGAFDTSRHGIFRFIPGLSSATPITVSSPDAPDGVQLEDRSQNGQQGVNIRIGDPATTVSGHKRYRIDYALPGVTRGQTIDWEPVGTAWEVGMDEAEIHLLTPYEIDGARCFQGVSGSTDTCDVREVAPGHVTATVKDLKAGEGVSIEGTVGAPVTPAAVPAPPADPPTDDGTGPLPPAGTAAAAGLVGAGLATITVRRAGRERVAPGGAADVAYARTDAALPWAPSTAAAPSAPPPPPEPATTAGWAGPAAAAGTPFGPPPPPAAPPPSPPSPPARPPEPAPVSEIRVDMTELAAMATTDFAPPPGVTPPQGGIVLAEEVRPEHKVAWLVQAAVDGAVDLHEEAGTVTVTRTGPGSPEQAAILDQALPGGQIELGTYDRSFGKAWSQLGAQLMLWQATSGLWDPRGDTRRLLARIVGVLAALAGGIATVGLAAVAGRWGPPWLAGVAIGALVAAGGLAAALTAWELRVRTPAGSGLWLRVESFRRFLAGSEAYHAEEAAKRGVLREYTAWALALGEFDRWSRAVQASTIIPADAGLGYVYLAPLLFYSTSATATAPSSSGGGGFGGGGFGGGSVGGGAGGGGGGSW